MGESLAGSGAFSSLCAEDRLIVALDTASVDDARRQVDRIGDACRFYKIGHALLFTGGMALADELKRAGKKVFIDAKLLDIGSTVENGVRAIAGTGVDMVTVHAYPDTMAAAARGAADTGLTVLAVTVLTSMSDIDLEAAGYGHAAGDLVVRRAVQAAEAGIGGIVCSPNEVAAVREAIGPASARQMSFVTPGIRPATAEAGDQKRIATPAIAIQAGATHIVVGRPVIRADDPAAAALAIIDEMARALA